MGQISLYITEVTPPLTSDPDLFLPSIVHSDVHNLSAGTYWRLKNHAKRILTTTPNIFCDPRGSNDFAEVEKN